jgi:tRNA nucleotidyltransferase (CCA-adding enzyme)
VVEVSSASRLGELEPVALDPDVETVLFDHHDNHSVPEWVSAESAVLSGDGALTTTLVGIVAERELSPTALEATAFALGIHEDTGSLTYVTTTQRDVDALSWCVRHGARQELVNEYLHTPLAASERDLLKALMERLEPVAASGEEVLVAGARVARVRRRRLEPRTQDRRPHGCPCSRAARRDGRARVRGRAKPH